MWLWVQVPLVALACVPLKKESPANFYMDSLITLDINSIGIFAQAVNFIVLGVLGVVAFYVLRFFVRIIRYIHNKTKP